MRGSKKAVAKDFEMVDYKVGLLASLRAASKGYKKGTSVVDMMERD